MASDNANGRRPGVYVEIILVTIALLAVLAWLGALLWVLVTGGPEV